MTQNQTATALLILRITLGIFLLQWGVEKFMVPDNTPAIWGHFYGISIPASAAIIFGIFEVALALCASSSASSRPPPTSRRRSSMP